MNKLASKEVQSLEMVKKIGQTIDRVKHGDTNAFNDVEAVWFNLIALLATEYELTHFEEIPLFTGNEGRRLDSIYGMGRVFLGGTSAEGAVHTETMRSNDISLIDRFVWKASYRIVEYTEQQGKNHAKS